MPPHEDSTSSPFTPTPGDVLLCSRSETLRYRNPVKVLRADSIAEIEPALVAIRAGVESGLHAAGFLSYEAAPAFDAAFAVHDAPDGPLLWFGLYESAERLTEPPPANGAWSIGDWTPAWSREAFTSAVESVRALIAAGDTYQVNLTFPLRAEFRGDAYAWFQHVAANEQTDYRAYIQLEDRAIASFSPELFFRLENGRLTTRPMKGTAPRGLSCADDRDAAERMRASAKERAENLMIVDLLRNDMGRVATPGTVEVERLFEAERYPTVWQMTSTIGADIRGDCVDVFRALFPSGSVTGAPKIRTMEIIRALEPESRGVYCGAIGRWSPGGVAEFSVAIRTATVDIAHGAVTYPVGADITWDSVSTLEYDECLLKAKCLDADPAPMRLIETMLWENGAHYLLDRHLDRLRDSAAYFGYACDASAIRKALEDDAENYTQAQRVRLLLNRDGAMAIEHSPAPDPKPFTLVLAPTAVDETSPHLYHKTTRREVYENAYAQRGDADDVILYNSRGELTETTIANLVLVIDGEHCTPPVASGLLPGVMREELLARGELQERVLTKADLEHASEIYLVNSVRKRIPATLSREQESMPRG